MVKERAWNDEDIKSYKILVNKSKIQKKGGRKRRLESHLFVEENTLTGNCWKLLPRRAVARVLRDFSHVVSSLFSSFRFNKSFHQFIVFIFDLRLEFYQINIFLKESVEKLKTFVGHCKYEFDCFYAVISFTRMKTYPAFWNAGRLFWVFQTDIVEQRCVMLWP